jgi:acetyl esterase/lipase
MLLTLVACKPQAKEPPRSIPVPSASTVTPVAPATRVFPRNQLAHSIRTAVRFPTERRPAPDPPAQLFEKIRYAAPLGPQVAYVSRPRGLGKHPAIVWIAGGFDWDISDNAWKPAPRHNDQSARAFRDANVILMLPSLRGSNENPGHNECFLGEVDDILAAAETLAQRAEVDASRIFLGGHSTGATLALLAAASTDRFRAVFAFGPAADPRFYNNDCPPESLSAEELRARSPVEFLGDIRTPTFVIEGEGGNLSSFPILDARKKSAPVTFLGLRGHDHFSVLAPVTELLASKIIEDRDLRTPFVLPLDAP